MRIRFRGLALTVLAATAIAPGALADPTPQPQSTDKAELARRAGVEARTEAMKAATRR